MRRWMIVLVLVVVAAGIGVALRGRTRSGAAPAGAPGAPAASAAVPVEVARVVRGSVARGVEVSGTVVAPRSADIMAKLSGRVARVFVEDGARVAAGQALVQLDASDQRLEVRQAEAAAAAAAARLALLEAGQRPQERQVVFNAYTQAQAQVKAAETQVAVAQATLRTAEDNLRRQEQLFRDGAVAQAQVDQARLQADQARAQLQAAQAQLDIARTAVDSARQQWDMTQTGARPEEIAAARAQLAQARAVVAQARQRLASMTIRAPFAGRLTGLNLSPGDHVTSGDFPGRTALAQVYDDRVIEVEVKVGERDLAAVRVGQPAVLRLDGAGGAAVPAVVHLLSPAADPASRSATVRLRLQSGQDRAIPGTFARGEIIVERRTGVLLVPRAAVGGGDAPVVRVVADGVVQVRRVALGLAQGDRIEVRSGLAEGETVVVLGPQDLAAGTAVRVVNP